MDSLGDKDEILKFISEMSEYYNKVGELQEQRITQFNKELDEKMQSYARNSSATQDN